jgi:hypothetical protein
VGVAREMISHTTFGNRQDMGFRSRTTDCQQTRSKQRIW